MRILLFTGKGGVGKTTTAAATALRLADRGAKTLLLSVDAAHSVADALGVRLGTAPTEVVPSLWAMHLDSQHRLEAGWLRVQRYLHELLDRSGIDPITAAELTVLPGIEQLLALLAVRELAGSGDCDHLVVDCAPTAETLRLLALPEALGWYLNKVYPAHRLMARSLRPLAALLGRGEAIPAEGVFDALLALGDELAAVRALLINPDITSVRLVLTPEAMVAAEARRTFTALSLYGYRVDLVVANRVFPGDGTTWLQGWASAQRSELDALAESFGEIPIREVPYGPVEPIGVEALREVANHLYWDQPGRDPAEASVRSEGMRVERAESEFVLIMALPLAESGEVEAVRAGDDLVLTVGGYRRVLSLPSVLRRCVVIGGRFADGQLRVRFRPDPALWPATEGSAT